VAAISETSRRRFVAISESRIIMGAIKDIVDLCITLKDEVGGRKVAQAISRIQSLTLALQSEQAGMMEKNAELLMENLDLKRKVFDLEASRTQSLAQIQEAHRAELAGQAATLEKNAELLAENLELKRKVFDLEAAQAQALAEIQETHRMELAKVIAANTHPKDQLDRQTAEVLKLFFNSSNELSSLQIALAFKLSPSVAEYHLDELLKRQFIVQSRSGAAADGRPSPGTFRIRAEGRAYIVTNSLSP
jgi:hypothetical protein